MARTNVSTCPACLRAVSRTSDDGRCYACANVCSACEGAGIEGDEHTHRTCDACWGTGTARPEHWHSGPLGADQFCAACDGEAA